MLGLTTNQQFIMSAVIRGNDSDSEPDLDMDQLLDAVPYDVSKESMQFSLRPLIKKNLISKSANMQEREKRRGSWRTIIKPTDLGIERFSPYLEDVRKEELAIRREKQLNAV